MSRPFVSLAVLVSVCSSSRGLGLLGVALTFTTSSAFHFSESGTRRTVRTRIAGPPLIVGHDTVDIMTELGISKTEIDALIADGVVLQSTLRQERAL